MPNPFGLLGTGSAEDKEDEEEKEGERYRYVEDEEEFEPMSTPEPLLLTEGREEEGAFEEEEPPFSFEEQWREPEPQETIKGKFKEMPDKPSLRTRIGEKARGEFERAKGIANETRKDMPRRFKESGGKTRRIPHSAAGKPAKLSRKQMSAYVGGMGMKSYYPSGMRKLNTPTGMQKLSVPQQTKKFKSGALSESVQPQLGRLQRAGDLTLRKPVAKPMRIGKVAMGYEAPPSLQHLKQQVMFGGNETLARMRRLTMPKGLSEAEGEAFLEIKQNGDIDTRSHVIEELSKLGISKADASRAIASLTQKGLINDKGMYQGEPVLELKGAGIKKA